VPVPFFVGEVPASAGELPNELNDVVRPSEQALSNLVRRAPSYRKAQVRLLPARTPGHL